MPACGSQPPPFRCSASMASWASAARSAGRRDNTTISRTCTCCCKTRCAGVLQLIAFEKGDTKPQLWVPESTETYMTAYWNAAAMYEKIVTLVDRFQYQGATDKFVADKLSEPLGIDFPTQVIDNLAGRVTLVAGYDMPARMNSQHHLLAIELNDEKFARDTLQTIIDKYPDQFRKRQVRRPGLLGSGAEGAEGNARGTAALLAQRGDHGRQPLDKRFVPIDRASGRGPRRHGRSIGRFGGLQTHGRSARQGNQRSDAGPVLDRPL